MRRFAALIFLLLLPFAARAQNPQTTTNPPFAVDSTTANGIAVGYRLSAGAGLTLNISAGGAQCGSEVDYAGGTLTMANNTTNYVYLNADSSCLPASNTTGFNSLTYQIGTVVTSGGAITTITQNRGAPVNPEGGVVPRVYAGTTDTIVATDRGNLVSYSNSGAVAVTLPAQSTAGFGHNFVYSFLVNGAGTVTVTTTDTVVGGTSGTTIVAGSSVGCTVIGNGTSTYYVHCSTTNTSGSAVSSVTGGGPVGASPTTGAVVLSCTTCTVTIANGTSALGTGAITSGTCATVVTTTATGTAATDNIMADFNADPTGTTGYAPAATGMLTIIKYPTSGNVNFKVCNNTAGSITPGAATLNWRVTR